MDRDDEDGVAVTICNNCQAPIEMKFDEARNRDRWSSLFSGFVCVARPIHVGHIPTDAYPPRDEPSAA